MIKFLITTHADNTMEVILMVGIHGSGKTTLSNIAFPNHTHISLDKPRDIPSSEKIDILSRHKNTLCCNGLSNDRKRESAFFSVRLSAYTVETL